MQFPIIFSLLLLGVVGLNQAGDCSDDGLCAEGNDDMSLLQVHSIKHPAEVHEDTINAHYDDGHPDFVSKNEKSGKKGMRDGKKEKLDGKKDKGGSFVGKKPKKDHNKTRNCLSCSDCTGDRGACYEECHTANLFHQGEPFSAQWCPPYPGCVCR
eukprot:gnl/TRDRNA2_/TRDRNA2_172179_c0_seq16.p1 gnl/TRDRNA2_/TRDRNA2_172179_c0~~gnl/TRDRNA2_/TRDRNA2_172179_c0_seq16.p1  ORF type:complete len:155 (+),score=25.92 gnl/TRDRNA2_/TRDRNA2_172179_c0_seq16:60-524(+)